MKASRHAWLVLALLLPFADACTDLKRLAYSDMGRRDGWQEPERVVEALKIVPGSKVGDVGAGGGYFSFRLADATGAQGLVYAADVDEAMLEGLAAQAQQDGYENVRTVHAGFEDPKLPETVDLIFVSNTYHHIENRVAYFQGVQRHLNAGGRVAILEYTSDGLMQSCGHSTQDDTIRIEMERAGYEMLENFEFLDRQSFQVFQPKAN